MLARLLPASRHVRAVRIGQVLLVTAGAFLLLNWMEARPAPVDVGHESLALSLTAPVVHPRGPWAQGTAFTDASPGIPVDVAPGAVVRARYIAAGLDARDIAWAATLRVTESSDGLAWWSIERPLPIRADGEDALVDVDMAGLLAEALAADKAAAVPGTLAITVNVTHTATVSFKGEAVAVRTARLALAPSGDAMLVTLTPDEGVYREYPAVPAPWLAGVALAAAAVLEAALAAGRRTWPAWERFPGARFLLAEVHVPDDAAWTDLASLMAAARRGHATAIVDAQARVAILPGPVTLAAHAGLFERTPDAIHPRPMSRFHHASGGRPPAEATATAAHGNGARPGKEALPDETGPQRPSFP